MESLKILWASEALNYKTGYSTVSRELCERWDKMGHSVSAIGWYVIGDPYPYIKQNKDKTFSPTNIMQYAGEYSIGCGKPVDNKFSVMYYRLNEINPDVVTSLVDIWYSAPIIKETNELKVPYVNYFPIDGILYNDYLPASWLNNIQHSNRVLAMSKWGKGIMDKNLERVKSKKDIPVVYHGVNLEDFYRLKDKSGIEAMKKRNRWDGKFIVGFVGKNMSRKQITRLILSFKKFHEIHKDTILLMNIGNPLMSDYGGNLPELLKILGMTDSVFIFGAAMTHNSGVSVEALNGLYNMFDVFASCSSGEGWGLTHGEAMACGVPCILNDYTTSAEQLGDGAHGWLIPPKDYVEGQFGVLRALADTDKFADAMCEAYEDTAKRRKFSQAAEKWARENLNWDDIAKQYIDVLKDTIDRYRPPVKRVLPKAGFRQRKKG